MQLKDSDYMLMTVRKQAVNIDRNDFGNPIWILLMSRHIVALWQSRPCAQYSAASQLQQPKHCRLNGRCGFVGCAQFDQSVVHMKIYRAFGNVHYLAHVT